MSIIAAQQLQEKYVNRTHDSFEQYNVRDKIWLNMRNIKTDWSSKKLNACQRKFMILKCVDSHAYWLNIFEVHSVFEVRLLRSMSVNSFLSQIITDDVSSAIIVDKHEEWEVEKILDKRIIERDESSIKKYKIKWKEDSKTYWNRIEFFVDTEALSCYEQCIAAHADRANNCCHCQHQRE
jgi:hypothetical protein